MNEQNISEIAFEEACTVDPHRAPVPPGNQIWVRGWTAQLGERKTTFAVQVFDDHEVVCEGTLTLVAASRDAIEKRMATKR